MKKGLKEVTGWLLEAHTLREAEDAELRLEKRKAEDGSAGERRKRAKV